MRHYKWESCEPEDGSYYTEFSFDKISFSVQHGNLLVRFWDIGCWCILIVIRKKLLVVYSCDSPQKEQKCSVSNQKTAWKLRKNTVLVAPSLLFASLAFTSPPHFCICPQLLLLISATKISSIHVFSLCQSIGFIGPGIALIGLTSARSASIASAWLTLAVGLKSFSHSGFLVNLQVSNPTLNNQSREISS